MNRYEKYLYENFKNFKTQFIGDAWWRVATEDEDYWGEKVHKNHPMIHPYTCPDAIKDNRIYYNSVEIKSDEDFARFIRRGQCFTGSDRAPKKKKSNRITEQLFDNRDNSRLCKALYVENGCRFFSSFDAIRREGPGVYYALQKDNTEVRCQLIDFVLCYRLLHRGFEAIGLEGYKRLASVSSALPIATKIGYTSKVGNEIIFGLARVYDYNNRHMTFLKKNKETNKYVLTNMDIQRVEQIKWNQKTNQDYTVSFELQTGTHFTADLDRGMTYVHMKGKNKANSSMKNNSYGAAKPVNPDHFGLLTDAVYTSRKKDGFYVNRDYELEHMVRFPNLTTKAWNEVRFCKLRSKLPIDISDGEAMRRLGITKGLREYPWAICSELVKMKFDQNSIIKICEALGGTTRIFSRTLALSYNCIQSVMLTIREMKKQHWSIKEITNRIVIDAENAGRYQGEISSLFYTMRDIGHMLAEMRKEGIPCVINQNNFGAIHENCVRLAGKIKRAPNQTIDYTKKEVERLERVVDGYRFFLPVDTHTIISIGEIMHHCVGGYAADAAKRNTTIIACLNPEGRLVNCLEIKGDTLCQAKCRHDHKPLGEVLDVINKYAEECKLNSARCYDLSGADYNVDGMAKKRASHLKEHEDYLIEGNKIKVLALNNPIGREIYAEGIWQYENEYNPHALPLPGDDLLDDEPEPRMEDQEWDDADFDDDAIGF